VGRSGRHFGLFHPHRLDRVLSIVGRGKSIPEAADGADHCLPSRSITALVMALTPVRIAGSGTGANSLE
jgi:hypothetical protein